ncbi:hypothetical protein [Novosphingobium umbonatum]|uniref:hypothetical protein n=1 Tax=Novosphingobium umbonatum TaxID=1908524 RepID=UPI0013E368DE|nr:hypothetical protein [Novosphingobium umbonatum]
MRVALLFLLENAAGEAVGLPRGLLRVGGHVLARHQLALALALGCERVVCFARQSDPEVIALHHAAETGGAIFHLASSLHSLLSLVTAQDEVIALADGVLAWPDLAIDLLGSAGVLAQPAEGAIEAGFERLDASHAAAGAIRFPGRLVAKLEEWPSDIDIFSTLQRLALQAGVPMRVLPEDVAGTARWNLLRSENDAHAIEAPWIAQHIAEASPTPTQALAMRCVRSFGPALMHAGSGGTAVAIAGGVFAALGVLAGWFGHGGLGLCLAALAWLGFSSACVMGRFERRCLLLPRPRTAPVLIYAGIMDGALLLLLTAGLASPSQGLLQAAFAPLMLLGLLRLVPRLPDIRWAALLEDRALWALALAVAELFGLLPLAVCLSAMALLLAGVFTLSRQNQLTPR